MTNDEITREILWAMGYARAGTDVLEKHSPEQPIIPILKRLQNELAQALLMPSDGSPKICGECCFFSDMDCRDFSTRLPEGEGQCAGSACSIPLWLEKALGDNERELYHRHSRIVATDNATDCPCFQAMPNPF